VLAGIAALPVLLLAAWAALCTWGNRIETTTMGPFTSVEELAERMPCFAGLEIEASTYQSRTRARRFEFLSAPGDAWYERWGNLTLTPESAAAVQSAYSWKEVPRSELPQIVRELGPEGDRFLISERFNEGFDRKNSSSYWNGFAMFDVSSDRRTLYWFTRGEEHGIDDEFPPKYWK